MDNSAPFSWTKNLFTFRNLSIGFIGVCLLALVVLSGKIFETCNAGWFCVKQAAGSGTMSARIEPGMFLQLFGDIFKYKQSDVIYFSKHEREGRDEDESIQVRFNDGATASVTGNVRIELPNAQDQLIAIHKKFRGYDSLIRDTVDQVVAESVILTAALMSAEESYTTKRSEFSQMAYDQVRNGVYLTEATTVDIRDQKTGETTKKQIVSVKLDAKGEMERKEPVLQQYGIRVTQFVIKEIDYERGVNEQISMKQQSLMKTVAAKAEAEKAVQDRLTAEEVGKKNVAVAKYEQEVEKAKAVTSAEKELEVARLNKLAAEQYKQTQILKAEGDAEYRRKIMAADGALEKKLQAYVDTQKAWAEAMSRMSQPVVPGIVTGGGSGGSNAAVSMMELLGIKAAKDLALDIKPR